MSLFRGCSGILRRVSHASAAQDDLSGPLVRGEASAAVPFWYFGGGPCPARPQLGSATNRSLRQRIATQHSVGHEETRMPCGMSVRDSESRTARVSVATVAVVAMASGRDAVAAEANIRGKCRGYLRR